MTQRKLIIISACALISVLMVLGLYAYTSRQNHYGNGFIRLYPPHVLSGTKELNLGSDSHYICGLNKSNIYLGNFDNPKEFIVVDKNLTTFKSQTLAIPGGMFIQKSSAILKADSPNLYLIDGINDNLLRWQLNSLQLLEVHKLISNTLALPISSGSIVMRLYNNQARQSYLIKYSYDSLAPTAKLQLQKQVDGFFCSDGELHYSKPLSSLVYVYFFRNQFICMDTNLNIQSYGKTIDTNTKAKIKVAAIRNNTYTLSSPPMYVNNTACVDGELLFINSRLKATNESKEQFNQASVIDIYSLKAGLYKYSLYVPDFNGKKITNFKVDDRHLFVVQGKYVSVFQLNLP
ncbi:MAG: hypothetical protein JST70_16900 [Bacteroidetes bacterium]|nr:hypothetical protein [Bacteroidota bacterium]